MRHICFVFRAPVETEGVGDFATADTRAGGPIGGLGGAVVIAIGGGGVFEALSSLGEESVPAEGRVMPQLKWWRRRGGVVKPLEIACCVQLGEQIPTFPDLARIRFLEDTLAERGGCTLYGPVRFNDFLQGFCGGLL